MASVGWRLSPKSQQVVTTELIAKGRRKPSFVRERERERERRLIRSGVGANIRKGATILGEDRTMAFWRVSGTPTRPRTMH